MYYPDSSLILYFFPPLSAEHISCVSVSVNVCLVLVVCASPQRRTFFWPACRRSAVDAPTAAAGCGVRARLESALITY